MNDQNLMIVHCSIMADMLRTIKEAENFHSSIFKKKIDHFNLIFNIFLN